MKVKVFSVYDAAVGAYMQPFFMRTKGEAIRAWMDTVANPQTQFNKHPDHFTLFEIGEYDEESGQFQNLPAFISHGTALEVHPGTEKGN